MMSVNKDSQIELTGCAAWTFVLVLTLLIGGVGFGLNLLAALYNQWYADRRIDFGLMWFGAAFFLVGGFILSLLKLRHLQREQASRKRSDHD